MKTRRSRTGSHRRGTLREEQLADKTTYLDTTSIVDSGCGSHWERFLASSSRGEDFELFAEPWERSAMGREDHRKSERAWLLQHIIETSAMSREDRISSEREAAIQREDREAAARELAAVRHTLFLFRRIDKRRAVRHTLARLTVSPALGRHPYQRVLQKDSMRV